MSLVTLRLLRNGKSFANILHRTLWFHSRRDIRARSCTFSVINPPPTWSGHKGGYSPALAGEQTERSRKESWQGLWQPIATTGNKDPALLTMGETFPPCQHTAHGAEVILPFMTYCTWHLFWHWRLHLFWGSVVHSQIAISLCLSLC